MKHDLKAPIKHYIPYDGILRLGTFLRKLVRKYRKINDF